MVGNNPKMVLKTAGTLGWVVGLVMFLFSWSYMTNTVAVNSVGSLAETLLFGILGITAFSSGTLFYLKSFDFLEK